jgi:hypothetical protein
MDIAKADKTSNRWATAIRGKRIPCSREHGKLCLGQPEMLRASQDNLPFPAVRGGFLQSRKPVKRSYNKPLNVQ